MENRLYNIVIKVVAIMVTVLASVILATTWIVSLPILLIYELIVFLCEHLTGNTTNHNYAGNNFITYYKSVKHIYNSMLNEDNFNILEEDTREPDSFYPYY